jgi:hypothetical protein
VLTEETKCLTKHYFTGRSLNPEGSASRGNGGTHTRAQKLLDGCDNIFAVLRLYGGKFDRALQVLNKLAKDQNSLVGVPNIESLKLFTCAYLIIK